MPNIFGVCLNYLKQIVFHHGYSAIDVFKLQKHKKLPMIIFCLTFSEEDSKANQLDLTKGFVQVKLPEKYFKLIKYKTGYDLECFKNLNINAINVETKVLQYTAHIFFEEAELKERLHAIHRVFCCKRPKSFFRNLK